MYFHTLFKAFWNCHKACEVKFWYGGFLNLAHEACIRHPKCKAVPFLSMHGITLSSAAAPVLYNTDNFGMISTNTHRWAYIDSSRHEVKLSRHGGLIIAPHPLWFQQLWIMDEAVKIYMQHQARHTEGTKGVLCYCFWVGSKWWSPEVKMFLRYRHVSEKVWNIAIIWPLITSDDLNIDLTSKSSL